MANNIQEITDTTRALQNNGGNEAELGNIVERCENMGRMVHTTVVAFQFYDRMTQKLDHVHNSLASLGALIGDPVRITSANAWNALQSDIRSSYTMEAERAMFDALMNGATVAEALELLTKLNDEQPEGDIDLF